MLKRTSTKLGRRGQGEGAPHRSDQLSISFKKIPFSLQQSTFRYLLLSIITFFY